MTPAPLAVLFRDRDWLAVDKPAGIPTTAPPTAGVRSLVDRVRDECAPDAALVHPLSRLDVEVTGLVLFATSARGMQRADAAREQGSYQRRYLALVAGVPVPAEGVWTATIGVDPRDGRRRVAGGGREPRSARSEYLVRGVAPPPGANAGEGTTVAWLELDLRTGRTHQVRVHAAAAGCPVLGDVTYGGARRVVLADGTVVAARRVMLHALRVVIPGSTRALRAPVPQDLADVWRALGGEALPPRET